MTASLPDRETAERNGWVYQVEWTERGCACFIRCRSGREADARARELKRQGVSPRVIDLREALRVH
jgi:hypothetical protein